MPTPEQYRVLNNQSDPHLEDLAKMAEELQAFAKLRLPNLNARRYKRSAPLSFIGDLSRGLFGTASIDDVIKIRDTVNNMAKQNLAMSAQLSHSAENMVSFSKAVNERMDNIESMLKTQHDIMETLWERIETNEDRYERQQQWVSDMFKLSTERYIAFVHAANTMVDTREAILDIGRGKLSDTIISDADFLLVFDELKKVQSEMGKHFHFLETDPVIYYQHAKFSVYLNDTDLWVTLQLPVGENVPANSYRVHTWSVPVYNGSTHSTQVQGLSEYVAIHDNYNITSLSSKSVNQCVGKKSLLCPFSLFLKQLDGSSCLSSIWSGVSAAVHSACKFGLMANSIQPSMTQIAANKVLVQDISTIKIMCGRQSTIHQGCHSCILDIPCGCCIIASEQLYIVPTKVECSNVGSPVTRTEMVNFAVLRTFLNNSLAAKINHRTKIENAQKLSLIKFETLDAYFNESMEKQNDVKKHIRDIIKESELIERQDHALEFASRYPLNMSFIKTPSFGLDLFVLIVIVGLVIVLIYFWRKCRRQNIETARENSASYSSLKDEIDLLRSKLKNAKIN